MIFQSIRWRLQLWHGLILLAVLAGFGVTAWQLERNLLFRNIDREFQPRMDRIAGPMRPPPPGPGRDGGPPEDFGGPPEGPRDGPPEGSPDGPPPRGGGPRGFRPPPPGTSDLFGSDTNAFFYVVWSPQGAAIASSSNAPAHLVVPSDLPGGAPSPPFTSGELREAVRVLRGGEIVLVGRSIAVELTALRRVGWSLLGVGAVVRLLGMAGGWWIATRAIAPIEDISATAVKIAGGDLSQRINVADPGNELGRLAEVLNSTFARLQAAFAQQQQFTSDAAHELRTPLSVILTQTQTTLNRERNAEEYRQTLESCQRAAQRMRHLTESLLQLARVDAGRETMKRLHFDFSETVAESIELVRPLAVARHIQIHAQLQPLPCVGNPERLSQVVANLLANAIEYNRDGGEVRLQCQQQDGAILLRVGDTGPGIAPVDLPRIFDRFYRADKSRSGADGHTGLGLAICKAIVEAHGGTIEAASQPGEGSVFTVRLPAAV